MDEVQELKTKVEMLERRIEKLESAREVPVTRRYTPSISTRIPSRQVQTSERKSPWERLQRNGKSLLSIIASILIFIGLITFAALIFDKLGVWGQVSLMYIFSVALYSAGLFMFTKKQNMFSLSLWGCGVGSVYISIFSTRLYFNLFTDISLYCALAAWSIIMLLVYSKIQNNLPINVASIAISLSIIFGAVKASNINEFSFIAIYFILLVGGFTFLLEKKKVFLSNIFMCISSFIALLVYITKFFAFIGNANALYISFLCLLFSVYLPLQMGYCIQNISNAGMPLRIFYKLFTAPIVISIFCIIKIFVIEEASTLLILGIPTFLILSIFALFEFARFPDYTNITRFLSIIGLVYLFSEFNVDVLIPILAAFMAYFIYNKDTDGIVIAAIDSIITMAFIIPESHGVSLYSGSIGLVFALISIIIIFFKFKKAEIDPSRTLKNLLLSLLVVASACCGMGVAEGTKYCYTLGILIGTVPLIVSQAGILRSNWVTLDIDRKQKSLFSVLAFVAMLIDIRIAVSHEFTALAMGLAILAFILDPELKSLSTASGPAIGIQFIVLCTGILGVFVKNSEMPFLFTLMGIFISAVCIYIGFKFTNKSFKNFGIGVLMAGIAKLLLFDVQYGSSIGTAIGFMCAGLLCFGIVWLYNKFEKKNEKV